MMLFGVLDNLVTDRPDNAPPLAGKAFHGSPWHEFFRVNETRQFSIHQVQASEFPNARHSITRAAIIRKSQAAAASPTLTSCVGNLWRKIE